MKGNEYTRVLRVRATTILGREYQRGKEQLGHSLWRAEELEHSAGGDNKLVSEEYSFLVCFNMFIKYLQIPVRRHTK